MKPGEIVLAHFPLGGTGGRKLRPTLVLSGPLGSVPEYVVAYISSVIPPILEPTDLVMDPKAPGFSSTKLKVRSVVRAHKLATIHGTDVIRRLGIVSPTFFLEVQARLRIVLGL